MVRFWSAAVVTLAFTLLARWLRGVSISGAMAGAAVCFALYVAAGSGAFLALIAVFGLTWLATRFGYRSKQALGTAQNREGRTASQVLANLAVAGACALLFGLTGKSPLLLATAAALSEAAADTVSSELGQAHNQQARLITTWEVVAAGTDGGVTLFGTAAGIAAATVTSFVYALVSPVPLRWLGISVFAAVLGMTMDSYLGAALERRKVLNNDWVNFLSTVVAAGVAVLLA
jgi:uncharacterized protein (TIGR00297 family)